MAYYTSISKQIYGIMDEARYDKKLYLCMHCVVRYSPS